MLDDRAQDRGFALVQLGHAGGPVDGQHAEPVVRFPVGTRCYRVPTAPASRSRGGHIGREQPALSGQHDPVADPPHESGRGELVDHARRPRRRPARRRGCAAPARRPPRPGAAGSSRSDAGLGRRPRLDRGDVALGRAHVPPAPRRPVWPCAAQPIPRYSPSPQYRRLWRHSSPGRAQFDTSYHSRPAAPSISSASRYASACTSSSGAAAPAATRRPSGVAGSTVSAYALTCATSSAIAPASVARQSSIVSPGVP